MTTYRPAVQHQGPDTRCVIHGVALGWESCTCYSTAMMVDRSTLGKQRPTGCTVRSLIVPADLVGGTTLRQNADAVHRLGVHVDVFAGSGVARSAYTIAEVRKGRGAVLQGNTAALLRTRWRSTEGPVNHAVALNEITGGSDPHDWEGLVYDPAADGRKRSYHVDVSASWWPGELVLAFAAALRPWGDGDPRRLGPGWQYVSLFPDTEPHVILRPGAKRTAPFPDRTRADAPKGKLVNVRSGPSIGNNIVGHLKDGELFVAYQVTDKGESFRGSTRWYGDQKGTRWVHSKRLTHEGGST